MLAGQKQMIDESEAFVATDSSTVTQKSGFRFFRSVKLKRQKSSEKPSLQELCEKTFLILLKDQNEVTGLVPSASDPDTGSVHDNVYTALTLFYLSTAVFRQSRFGSENKKNSNELLTMVKKMMKTILLGFEVQVTQREEAYCKHFPGIDPHVHLDLTTGRPMEDSVTTQINQSETGPGKIEAVALFLLVLAQMSSYGLKIVQTASEVSAVQNLIIYIQSIYYRVDTDVDSARNQIKFDDPTMKISTIAMIKSVLDAYSLLNSSETKLGFNLYTIQTFQYDTIQTMLLLKQLMAKALSLEWLNPSVSAAVSFPSFAVRKQERKKLIVNAFTNKYQRTNEEEGDRGGGGGASDEEFNKDKMEILCHLCLYHIFNDDVKSALNYRARLNYYVNMSHEDFYQMFTESNGSDSSFTYITCRSLFIIIDLLLFGYLQVKDADPLSLSSTPERGRKVKEVHVVVITGSTPLQIYLKKNGIDSQLVSDLEKNFQVFPDDVLQHFLTCLAYDLSEKLNDREDHWLKLQFSLRDQLPNHNSSNMFYTAQLYTLRNQNLIFVPRDCITEMKACYLGYDAQMFCDLTVNNLKFLSKSWISNKTPLYFVPIKIFMSEITAALPSEVERLLKKIKSGFVGGTRVKLIKMLKVTDQYIVSNLDLLASNKSEAKRMLSTMSSFYYADYREEEKKAANQEGVKKPSDVKVVPEIIKKAASFQVQSVGSNKLKMPGETAFSTTSIVGLPRDGDRVSRVSEMVYFSNTVARWLGMDFNWLPEQIGDFIANSSDVTSGQNVTDEQCMKLLTNFETSKNFMERARILKRLYSARGLNWIPEKEYVNKTYYPLVGKISTSVLVSESANRGGIRIAVQEMYKMSRWSEVWWMVRYAAGLMGTRLDNLSVALSDIVMRRRKQVIIGCTPNNKIVIAKSHRDIDIMSIIQIVSRNNPYMISLLQEILVSIWMVYLFNASILDQLVCVDVQSVYQAMVTDLAVRFECNEDMASVYLACLSPFELKCFVEVVLRGDEIAKTGDIFEFGKNLAKHKSSGLIDNIDGYLQSGLWLKRRCLDGVLMRLPEGFIENTWLLLKKSKGISFDGHLIKSEITEKYNHQNLNFTAIMYATLRLVKPPELLQLFVEVTYLLAMVAKNTRLNIEFKKVINVNEVVIAAVNLFLKNQNAEREFKYSKACCTPSKNISKPPFASDTACKMRGGICWNFYDSAPTGEFGTMTFITDAILSLYAEDRKPV